MESELINYTEKILMSEKEGEREEKEIQKAQYIYIGNAKRK